MKIIKDRAGSRMVTPSWVAKEKTRAEEKITHEVGSKK